MFLLSDLAITTSENEGLALTITPEASLEADFVIRYFITGAGFINIEADTAISYDIPATAFADQDANDALTYAVSSEGGGALPSWLRFANNSLSGTPTSTDIRRYVLDVTATDKGGLSVVDKLVIAPELSATKLDNSSFYLGTAHSTHSGGRKVGTLTVNQTDDFTASLTGSDASYFTLTTTGDAVTITYKENITDDSRTIGTAYDVALVITDSDASSRTLTLTNLNIIQGKEIISAALVSGNVIIGTSWDDVAVAPNNGLQANIQTFGGDDLIYGSNNGDIIRSGTGDDIIYAQDGGDIVYLSSGANLVDGGAGNDILDFGQATSGVTFDLSAETDSEGFFRATGKGLEGTRFKNFESIYATHHDDVIKGDDNVNNIFTRGGNNLVYSYGGDDIIFAEGQNTIYTGDGDDEVKFDSVSNKYTNYLYGEKGNDNLRGNSSTDYISGGTGTDIFTMGSNIGLAEARGIDIFTDFEQGEKIKLDLPNFSDDNKFTGTTIDDVLNAFKMTGQTNTWRISQVNTPDDSGKNDPTKLDTIIHYGAYGTSDYYIRFIFEDLDFDLTASHFEIV